MARSRAVDPISTVPGTREWAQAVAANARSYAEFAEQDARPLVERYRELCEHRAWEIWFTDEPRTLERFSREVLGYDAQFLETMSAGVAVLDKQGYSGPISVQAALDAVAAQARAREARVDAIAAADAVPLPGRGRPKKDVIHSFPVEGQQGESYLRRRLKRDRPDLYQQVATGGKSAHAAAVEAKIRPPTFTVRADDPEHAARTLRKHFTDPEQRVLLAKLLTEQDS